MEKSQVVVPCGVSWPVIRAFEEFNREASRLLLARIDRRQRRQRELRLLQVIESGDRDVVGNPHAGLRQGAHGTEGEHVVEGEDAVEGHGGGDHRRDRAGSIAAVPAPRSEDQLLVYRNAEIAVGREISLQARSCRALVLVGADGEHPAATAVQEVADHRARGLDVLILDAVEARSGPPLADEHEGQTGANRLVDLSAAQVMRVVDQPIDEGAVRPGQQCPLRLGVEILEDLQGHPERVLLRRRDDETGELGEVGVAQAGHDEADRARASYPKRPRVWIGLVVEAGDGGEHAFPGGRGNSGVVAQHVGDRGGGDPSEAGDVPHGDRAWCRHDSPLLERFTRAYLRGLHRAHGGHQSLRETLSEWRCRR